GYDRAGLLERDFRNLIPEDESPLEVSRSGRREHRLVAKDGALVDVEISSAILQDGRIQLIVRDSTQRKALEQQLRRAQKMDAIGRMAGGVAHDFNNLLTAILGYGDAALSGLLPDSPLHSYVQEILLAADKAAALTSQLLALSRKQTMRPRVMDLNAAIGVMG